MEFSKLTGERRSVRKYSGGIDRADLEKILRAAQRAPSWGNRQASRSYAVTTPEILEKLRSAALPASNQNNSANAVLVVTTFEKGVVGFRDGEPANEIGDGWGAYDLGLHDAYFVLAAKDLGYDTLIMGIRDSAAIREIIGVPDNEEILSVIAVGKRAEEPAVRPRKEFDEVVKFV
ncbi:MAG: nitroreductase family protein [Oscillospiraceae bacterium]|nr:nitroreductase family protein [Oscillospiraceae bacterium]